MPPPTSSVKPTAAKLNGAAQSKKEEAPAATSSGSGSSRPDKAAYDAEQDGYNKEIAAIKTKLVSVIDLGMGRCDGVEYLQIPGFVG
jgi:hypothetical protein